MSRRFDRAYKRDQGGIGPVNTSIKHHIAVLWYPSIEEGARYYAEHGKF